MYRFRPIREDDESRRKHHAPEDGMPVKRVEQEK